jgi:hypothetical protein
MSDNEEQPEINEGEGNPEPEEVEPEDPRTMITTQ